MEVYSGSSRECQYWFLMSIPVYGGRTDGNLVLLLCMNVRTEVNDMTVKVNITSVPQVSIVLLFRLRMLDIPSAKAAALADNRPTSAL